MNTFIARLSVILGICLAITGCGKHLDARYATTRGPSINGIGCFIDLVKKSGRHVDVWPGISPQMRGQYDNLIIIHKTFDSHRDFTNHQFSELVEYDDPLRVISVLRDSDWQVDYWRQISERPNLTPSQLEGAKRSHQRAAVQFALDATGQFEPDEHLIYGLERTNRTDEKLLKPITYDSEDESKTIEARWPLNRRLVPRSSAQILWRTGDEPLLIWEETSVGEHLVLTSAAPILNGGLVDKGNRQLATELIQMIPEDERTAIVLSTMWINDSEMKSPDILEYFRVHPNGWVFGQAILALLLFCWWKFPIFGRPRVAVNTETARFGRHVEAFGRLLRRTQDTNFARQRIRDWLETQSPRKHSETP